MHAERDTGIVAWHGGGITSCREEHASRVGRAAKMSTGTGTGTAASKGEGSEEWLLRAIPYLSASMARSPRGPSEHAPRVRARVDEWEPRSLLVVRTRRAAAGCNSIADRACGMQMEPIGASARRHCLVPLRERRRSPQ